MIPHLAEIMKDLGYIERLGRGIPLVHKELEKNDNPPLEFFAEEGYVLAILRKHS